MRSDRLEKAVLVIAGESWADVELGSLVRVERGHGPDQVMHYNGYPAAEIRSAGLMDLVLAEDRHLVETLEGRPALLVFFIRRHVIQ